MKQIACFWVFLSATALNAQVNITTNNYSQNFNSPSGAPWVNNTTYPGWYTNATWRGYVSITGINTPSANASNSGGFYNYSCNGGSDRRIGARASGTAPNNNIYFGVVLRNQTGSTIESITVTYTGSQMSLAENQTNINVLSFQYAINAANPGNVTTGSFTTVAALNYTAPNNAGTAGNSNQLQWYLCTLNQVRTACINIPPLANNSYLTLRWYEANDPANDHHLAIDDVNVLFHFDNACTITLPVELLNFHGEAKDTKNRLYWQTASEQETDRFVLERSTDGELFSPIGEVKAAGNSSTLLNYAFTDKMPAPGVNYYRLQMIDTEGASAFSYIVALEQKALSTLYVINNGDVVQFSSDSNNGQLQIFSMDGRMIRSETLHAVTTMQLSNGVYLAVLQTESGEVISRKFVVAQ